MNGNVNAFSDNQVQSVDKLSFNDNRAQTSTTHQQKKQKVVVNSQNIIIRDNSKFNQSMSVLDSSKSKGRRSTKKQRDVLDNFSTSLLYGTQAIQNQQSMLSSGGPHLQIKMTSGTPDKNKKKGLTPDSMGQHEARSQSLLQFYKPSKINASKVKLASNNQLH